MSFHGTQCKIAVDVDAGVAFGDWLATDKVQSVSFDFEGNLADIYMLGDRDPQETKEGTIAISGTIERIFGSANFSASATTFCGMATDDPLDHFWVALFPEGDAAPKILISDCKFGGYSLSVDVNGVVTETATFHGLAIAVT